jgi:hypothetical protein
MFLPPQVVAAAEDAAGGFVDLSGRGCAAQTEP